VTSANITTAARNMSHVTSLDRRKLKCTMQSMDMNCESQEYLVVDKEEEENQELSPKEKEKTEQKEGLATPNLAV
jgi:hypothetical protein